MKTGLIMFYTLMVSLLFSSPAQAIIGINSSSFAEPDPGLFSSTDLTNAGSADLMSISSTPFGAIPNVNDGTGSFSSISEEDSQYPTTIIFNFNTDDNPLGYNISSVSTTTGLSQFEAQNSPWAIGFTELSPQLFTLSYSLVGEASFHELISVSDLGLSVIRQVTLTGLSSEISGGVDALRFVWNDPYPSALSGTLPSNETVTILREIDIFGAAITEQIPEPSTSALAISICTLLSMRWHRQLT